MTEILVLGNGISRLAWHELILEWPGEVWGCNRVYEEYGALLSRLTGHKEVLVAAIAEMKKHEDWDFRVWGGHLGKPLKCAEPFTCPKKYHNDSGTTLVAQALHEGHNVAVCGFDLGGWDVKSPELENVPKWNWVDRWRRLLNDYGESRVRFIGHDHKPYLLSEAPNDAYCHRYLNGHPHISDPAYIAVWEKWTGRKANELESDPMVKVKYKDGREAQMKDVIAAKLERKGKVEIVKQNGSKPQAKRSTKKKDSEEVEADA